MSQCARAAFVEAINGFEAIRGLSAAGLFQRRMENCLGKAAKSEVSSRRYSSIATNLTLFITQMISVCIVVVSVYRIQDGLMSMGALIGCTILSSGAMAPIGQVAALLSRLQSTMVSLKGLNEIVNLPQEREAERNYVRKSEFSPRIEFQDVTFSYSDDAQPAVRPGRLHRSARLDRPEGAVGPRQPVVRAEGREHQGVARDVVRPETQSGAAQPGRGDPSFEHRSRGVEER